MGSADVRAAVATFIEGAAIPGLNRVHSAFPYWADGSEWDLAANLGSGAIAGVHLAADKESRIALPYPTGQVMVDYTVALGIWYQFLLPSNTLTPVDVAAWADPLDVIIDGVKDLIRSDPNCGMPAVVWQSGQDKDDLRIARDVPRRLPGKVLSWNVLEWSVHEIIEA